MSHSHSATPLPRGVLIGAAALVAVTIALAGTARLTGLGAAHVAEPPAIESRLLTFADQSDGSIAVRDGATGRVIAEVAPGTNGFLRGALRGLARDRRQHGIGEAPPFRLSRTVDGRLLLVDTSTHRLVDLGAFGASNAGVFAGLLAAAGKAQP
ncbi:MAG: phosphonate-binding protein [Proteobacteria bacterium]|nr:phosphonate-binding protein [Pseudomonadota bacterium]